MALRSLAVLADEVKRELDVQEARADALDAKAGVALGFAGVLVALVVDRLHGVVAYVGAGLAAAAAVCAALAFVPRRAPALDLRQLRATYLSADEEFTTLRLMDTRIAMSESARTALIGKANLLIGAVGALAVAVVLTVIAGIFFQ